MAGPKEDENGQGHETRRNASRAPGMFFLFAFIFLFFYATDAYLGQVEPTEKGRKGARDLAA